MKAERNNRTLDKTFLLGGGSGGGESTHFLKAPLLYTQKEQQNVFFGNSSSWGIVRDE